LIEELEALTNWEVVDCGDLVHESRGADPHADILLDSALVATRNVQKAGAVNQRIYERVKEVCKDDAFVLAVGGDHSISIGAVQALVEAKPDLAVLWVNAHADINTPQQSLTGNIHGMGLAFLLGLFDVAALPGWEWMKPALKPDHVAYVGLRDVDEAEKRTIKEFGIPAYSMMEIDRHGIGRVMDMAIKAVNPHGTRPMHLSFDIDVVDLPAAQMWGPIDRVKGGMSYREVHYMAESLAETVISQLPQSVSIRHPHTEFPPHLCSSTSQCTLTPMARRRQ
jgi:arginase